MLRLFDYGESGNAYKVRLLLTQLGEPFERVHLDILKGETRGPDFLALNPNPGHVGIDEAVGTLVSWP